MKIAHVILTQDFGGAERYAANLANLQANHGHTVALLSYAPPRRGASPQNAAASPAPIRPHIRDIVQPNVRFYAVPQVCLLFDGWWIRRLLAHLAPDVVHVHLGRAGKALRAFRASPTVATLHLNYKAKHYGHCAGLIAVAAHQLPQVQVFPRRVQHIPNFLPVIPLGAATAAPTVAPVVTPGAQPFTFGVIARLHPEKNIQQLIRCFRRCFQQCFQQFSADARLLVVGSGPDAGALQHIAQGDARVHFIPHQTNPWPYYAQIDCFVSTSHSEAFGQTLLEAMGQGCQIIATQTLGAQDVLAGQPAILVPHGDDATLLEAMQRAHQRGQQAITYDLTRFQPEAHFAAVQQFYQKVWQDFSKQA